MPGNAGYQTSTGPSRTGAQHSFAQIPEANIQRSAFNRSCGLKTTFDAGFLIPIFVDEALPGDTFSMKMSHFARMTTPFKPLMDNLYLDVFFFSVPLRLLWVNWQKFNGEQVNPDDPTDFEIPQMVSTAVTGYSVGSLHDHFGLPTGIPGVTHSSLWHRAYNLIFNEWFRDQNLQDSLVVDTDDGPDDPADYVLQRRGKRHDYFTSCLPFPQKGPAVSLPFLGNAPVIPSGDAIPIFRNVGDTTSSQLQKFNSASKHVGVPGFGEPTNEDLYWDEPKLAADLTGSALVTINDLREAFQIQKMFERDARGGTRYTEIVRSHFNVISPDARMQRPEFLGGGSTRINVNPVAATVENENVGTPLGSLAAFVTSSSDGLGFFKSFTEHCVILGMLSVRADLTYQQGLPRMFSRLTRFDFYWPSLAHLGEQAVLNKEIYTQGTSADNEVFGYQERYAEYRYKPSEIHGQFRSTFAQTLDIWHLAQEFGSLPLLNADFIIDQPPINRVVAVPSEPNFMGDFWFSFRCVRPMPVYSVPGLVDHF